MEILKLTGIKKAFGPVQALNGVDLTVRQGEIHALIGENGAGKSTLMKILSGAYIADEGGVLFQDRPYQVRNPAEARAAGIAMIYQELTLAPHLSVAENICLGIEKSWMGVLQIDKAKMKECLTLLGHPDLDLKKKVGTLNIGIQQVIEIARALYSNASVIIMDEPTSSLSAADTRALFQVIRRLKEKQISVIYISHFLEEVKDVSDSFTVLRDGESVANGFLDQVSLDELVEHMVGRSIDEMYPLRQHTVGKPVMTIKNFAGIESPEKVSFSLHRGEILGIAGLVGSGRTETLRCLFGLDRLQNGEINLQDYPALKAHCLSPSKCLKSGLDLLSENRKEEGLATFLSITQNITLSALSKIQKFGFINVRGENRKADELCRELSVKCRDTQQQASALSGGNQQKVALARMLLHDSDILFMDEPTRGIDVGSKAEIYRLMMKLAARGKSIVMVSSYLPELLGVCDRLGVMHRGRMSEIRKIEAWDEHSIMLYASSGQSTGEAQ